MVRPSQKNISPKFASTFSYRPPHKSSIQRNSEIIYGVKIAFKCINGPCQMGFGRRCPGGTCRHANREC